MLNKKNTIIVPWIVTKPRYISSFKTPSGAHFSPKKKDKKSDEDSSLERDSNAKLSDDDYSNDFVEESL